MHDRETVKPLLQSMDCKLVAVINNLDNDKDVQALKDKMTTIFAEVLLTAKAEVLRPQSMPVSAETRVADEEQALKEYDFQLACVVLKRKQYPTSIQDKMKRKLLIHYTSLGLLTVDKEDTSLLMPDYQHRNCPREISNLATTVLQVRAKAKELKSLPNKVEELHACLDVHERYENQDWKSLLRKRQG